MKRLLSSSSRKTIQRSVDSRSKQEESLDFIKRHEPPEGYYLGFSGGKDSIVTYWLAKKAGVKFESYYVSTGLEAPEVVKFVRTTYPDVHVLRPEKSFFHLLPIVGYPTNFRRWCCAALKEKTSKQSPLKHRLLGVRAEEALARAARPRIDKHMGQFIYKPIFYWLEWEIWEYIEQNNLPYPSVYDEGFGRVGCTVCPFQRPEEKKAYMKRWPKFYVAFEKAMEKLWRNRGFDKKIPLRDFIDSWYRRDYEKIDHLESKAKKRLLK